MEKKSVIESFKIFSARKKAEDFFTDLFENQGIGKLIRLATRLSAKNSDDIATVFKTSEKVLLTQIDDIVEEGLKNKSISYLDDLQAKLMHAYNPSGQSSGIAEAQIKVKNFLNGYAKAKGKKSWQDFRTKVDPNDAQQAQPRGNASGPPAKTSSTAPSTSGFNQSFNVGTNFNSQQGSGLFNTIKQKVGSGQRRSGGKISYKIPDEVWTLALSMGGAYGLAMMFSENGKGNDVILVDEDGKTVYPTDSGGIDQKGENSNGSSSSQQGSKSQQSGVKNIVPSDDQIPSEEEFKLEYPNDKYWRYICKNNKWYARNINNGQIRNLTWGVENGYKKWQISINRLNKTHPNACGKN